MSAIQGTAAGMVGGPDSSRFNEMSSEDFMRIIFTELQQQDPFEPNDSSALLEQLNSIRAIESDMELSANLENIVFQNQLATAGNMIGKTVEGLTVTNDRVVGNVFAVVRAGNQIFLQLDTGWEIPADNVQVIVDPWSIPEDGSGSTEDVPGDAGDSEGEGDAGDSEGEGEAEDSEDGSDGSDGSEGDEGSDDADGSDGSDDADGSDDSSDESEG